MPKHRASSSQESFQEFVQRNARTLAYVGVGIVVLAGGAWFYVRSKSLKEQHAAQAYRNALQSIYAGNAPLAQSDLRKLSVRYAGTVAGTEGAMALAKLSYTEGKYQAGIDALKAARPVNDMAYDVHTLTAVGYEGLGKSVEAAKEHEAAASAARFDSDRDAAKASAARAYQAGGKREEAIKIWQELAKDPDAPAAAEARVRLGELTATPMKV
jgi:predicted negative regulator of RcsB-dependent stress response